MTASSSQNLFQENRALGKPSKSFLVNLCIEGHDLHVGPFPFEVHSNMTLLMLKMKVSKELGIQPSRQRWILGNVFVGDENATLLSSGVLPDSYIFLYVDPNIKETKQSAKSSKSTKNFSQTSVFTEPQSSKSSKRKRSLTNSEISNRGGQGNAKNKLFACDRDLRREPSRKSIPIISADVLLALKSKMKLQNAISHSKQDEIEDLLPLADEIKDLNADVMSKSMSDLSTVSEDDDHHNMACKANVQVTHLDVDPVEQNTEQNFSADANLRCTGPSQIDSDNVTLDLQRCADSPEETGSALHSMSEEINQIENDAEKECFLIEIRQNYERFLELDNLDLVPNADSFECHICLCFIPERQGVVLRDCLHTFCRDCLASVVVYACESSILCPYRDDSYSCNAYMQPREIKALVSSEVYDQYLQRSLTTAESIAEKSFHCKTPDCPGWCLIEDNVHIFHCPVCSHYNCLTCHAIHEGLNCRKYQDSLKQREMIDKDSEETIQLLDKEIKEGDAMKCPKCSVVLMKTFGCDWLKCAVCLTEVCWITKGFRWGPKGRGDLSAGCKCGVNGEKCHPECTYCH